MPSVGLEFITQLGVHIPDFVEAGLEMHTNMYHESSLNAKVTVSKNQIRLSMPAPKSNTQLLSFRLVPHMLHDTKQCHADPYHYFLTLLSLFEIQPPAAVCLLWSNQNSSIPGRRPDWLSWLPAPHQWSEIMHNSALLGRGSILLPDWWTQVANQTWNPKIVLLIWVFWFRKFLWRVATATLSIHTCTLVLYIDQSTSMTVTVDFE